MDGELVTSRTELSANDGVDNFREAMWSLGT